MQKHNKTASSNKLTEELKEEKTKKGEEEGGVGGGQRCFGGANYPYCPLVLNLNIDGLSLIHLYLLIMETP